MTVTTTPVPTPPVAWPTKPLALPLYDKWLYAADFHCPGYSPLMVDRLLRVARKRNVTKLVIGGDLTDQPTVSQWPNILPQSSLDQCLDSAGALLCLLGDTFDEIVIMPGNHDDRLAKRLNDYCSFEKLLYACIGGRRFSAKLLATDYTFVYLGNESNEGADAGVVCGHPGFYSKRSAVALSEVAAIQHRHVLGSHMHQQGLIWEPSGRYWAIDPGCMCDAGNAPYAQRTAGINKYPTWKNGMVFMKGNVPTMLGDCITIWSEWGAE